DDAAGRAEPGARLTGRAEGAHAVVHHAPDVDDPGVAGRGEGFDGVQDRDGRSTHAASPRTDPCRVEERLSAPIRRPAGEGQGEGRSVRWPIDACPSPRPSPHAAVACGEGAEFSSGGRACDNLVLYQTRPAEERAFAEQAAEPEDARQQPVVVDAADDKAQAEV